MTNPDFFAKPSTAHDGANKRKISLIGPAVLEEMSHIDTYIVLLHNRETLIVSNNSLIHSSTFLTLSKTIFKSLHFNTAQHLNWNICNITNVKENWEIIEVSAWSCRV